jgi:hypothetical protein
MFRPGTKEVNYLLDKMCACVHKTSYEVVRVQNIYPLHTFEMFEMGTTKSAYTKFELSQLPQLCSGKCCVWMWLLFAFVCNISWRSSKARTSNN